jgi:hypothetical protein
MYLPIAVVDVEEGPVQHRLGEVMGEPAVAVQGRVQVAKRAVLVEGV